MGEIAKIGALRSRYRMQKGRTMIVCDADNLSDYAPRPTRETIEDQLRQQTDALKDVRRRLRLAVFPKPMAIVAARN